MGDFIERDKGVIVACDFLGLNKLEQVVCATMNLPAVVGYKIGAILAMVYGLREVVNHINSVLPAFSGNQKIIYDHQKGGTDKPDMGKEFAKVIAGAGIDAAILFPFAGAKTQEEWTKAFQDAGLTVIIGAEMTQPGFFVRDGGVIASDAGEVIFKAACNQGVKDFVVPGNKYESIIKYKSIFDSELGGGNFSLYSPGLITQGGDITEAGKAAGNRWYAIIGRAIYGAEGVEGIRAAAEKVVSQIP